jgi:hypothetical protein
MVDEAGGGTGMVGGAAPIGDGIEPQPPRTLWGLLDRIAEFEKAIDPISERIETAISGLSEKIERLKAKAQEAHAMLDEFEKLKL